MKQSKRFLSLLLCLLLIAALGACGKKNAEPAPAESAAPIESAEPAESAEPTEEAAAPVRQDGEEFESVIMLEGMEETIRLRHIVNETAGFEMDFEYESFVRSSEPDRERFVWSYDDPANPENYLEVSFNPEDAETVAAAINESLSEEYDVFWETRELDGAGECIHLDASAVKGGNETADVLQAVYIIPAADGCRVAALRYIPEGSDGFGKRLANMVNTILVTEAKAVS
jgi:predicted small lipoprotein YifL